MTIYRYMGQERPHIVFSSSRKVLHELRALPSSLLPTVSTARTANETLASSPAWPFTGLSLAAVLEAERGILPNISDATSTWDADFGDELRFIAPDARVESQPELTTHLRTMASNLGWENLNEFLAAMALRAIFPRYDKEVSRHFEPRDQGTSGSFSYALQHNSIEHLKLLNRVPELDRRTVAKLNQRGALYRSFVRGLVEAWSQAGLLI
jgi:hypothetical protein